MKLDPLLLEILVCPDCKATLTVDQDHDELVCNGCGLIYPVRDDIPIMLVDEARRPDRSQSGLSESGVSESDVSESDGGEPGAAAPASSDAG